MKNRKDRSFEKELALTLSICGIVSNSIGIFTSLIKNYGSAPDWLRPLNLIACIFSLTIIIITTLISFARENYEQFNLLVTTITGFILFPIMFITTGNITGSFVFYFIIIPTAYGIAIRKKWQITFPIVNLGVYLFLFVLSLQGKLSFGDVGPILYNPVQLYSGFLSTYIFTFFCTHLITQRTLSEIQAYKDISSKDELTNIFNRRSFDEDIRNMGYKFGLMVDIDHFKNINDNFGHQMGDEALRILAKIILKYCSNEFKVYRYGGEEFFIISRFNKETTINTIKNIFEDIHNNFRILGKPITISCGISENKDDIEKFIEEADYQMYQAKHNGRDRIFFEDHIIALD